MKNHEDDGGRVAPLLFEIVDRQAVLVVALRFPDMKLLQLQFAPSVLRPYGGLCSSFYFCPVPKFGGCALRVHSTPLNGFPWFSW
jgi:hypothetical protein